MTRALRAMRAMRQVMSRRLACPHPCAYACVQWGAAGDMDRPGLLRAAPRVNLDWHPTRMIAIVRCCRHTPLRQCLRLTRRLRPPARPPTYGYNTHVRQKGQRDLRMSDDCAHLRAQRRAVSSDMVLPPGSRSPSMLLIVTLRLRGGCRSASASSSPSSSSASASSICPSSPGS